MAYAHSASFWRRSKGRRVAAHFRRQSRPVCDCGMGRSRNEISRGGKALLFEQPLMTGSLKFPIAINTMGSENEWRWRCSATVSPTSRRKFSLKAKPPTDLREGWSLLKQGVQLLHARPKHVKSAPAGGDPPIRPERSTSHSTSNVRSGPIRFRFSICRF